MFAGVRFHTAVVFLIKYLVVVVACVMFIPGFSRCRGYWIRVFCCLYMCSVDHVELPVLLYISIGRACAMFQLKYIVFVNCKGASRRAA